MILMKNYLKENYKQLLIKLIIVVGVLVLDLVTKIVFANIFSERYSQENFSNIVVIKNILSFTYTENIGAAFSIFSGHVVFLILFSIVFIGVFICIDYFYKEKNPWFVVGISLIVGGAIGNLIDRIFLGYVRDFISFDFIKNFAICNIADCAITIGCVCMCIYLVVLLVREGKEKNKNKQNTNKSADENSANDEGN